HFENGYLHWKDGETMLLDDGNAEKTFDERVSNADLEDMLWQIYPRDSVIFEENFDPGRIRHQAFFMKMYGKTKEEVAEKMTDVIWLPGILNQKIRFSSVNGAAEALQRVSNALAAQRHLRTYLENPGGTFNWRTIAGTDRLSAHSFGIAIDINVAHSNYWRWAPEFKSGAPLKYRNKIPMEIVAAFEKEGFIWGGKWFHYDTMHFEYRPELLL
ncbi:MAG: M15 family metallopeptidase, partial [Bacteroidota bacterium]